MADNRGSQILWSAVLIVGGVVALLFNLGVLKAYEPIAQYILAGALAIGSVGFFVSFATSKVAWWRLIPGWTLFALAAMVLLSVFGPESGRWVAALLFWGLAAAFLHIYLLARGEHWWAILPGGFLAVLGIVIALSGQVTSLELLGALLFGGVGVVFFLLYLAGGASRQWWALIPGSILVLFSLFIVAPGTGSQPVLVRWWPLVAIAAGLFLLWRSLRARPRPPLQVQHAPPLRPTPAAASAPGTSIDILPDPDK